MKTVVDKEYKSEVFTSSPSLLDKAISFEIYGQTVDRSYEDRSVYIQISFDGREMSTWLDGEEAIRLGQMFIEHGTKALEANMINHQLIHQINLLKTFINEGRVKKVVFVMVDDKPVNYGSGFKKFQLVPIWVKNRAPKYVENFTFDQVFYLSPIKKEYDSFLKSYKVPIEFRNYDHDETIRSFESWSKNNSLA